MAHESSHKPSTTNSTSLPIPSIEPRNHVNGGSERLRSLWKDVEQKISWIPLDKDGTTLQDYDDAYTSRKLMEVEYDHFDYDLTKFYDPDQLPQWDPDGRQKRRADAIAKAKADDEFLKELFIDWANDATDKDEHYWPRLQSMFKFALKRPLMPQTQLNRILKGMGIAFLTDSPNVLASLPDPNLSPSEADWSPEPKYSRGRARDILKGIDPDWRINRHPSFRYQDVLANGWDPKKVDSADLEENLIRSLQKTYSQFLEGAFPRSEAMDTYKKLLRTPDITDHDLGWRLQAIAGIPTSHILGDENAFDEGDLHEQMRYTYGLFKEDQICLDSAIAQYRNLLKVPNVPLSNLGWRLEACQIPRAHIYGNNESDSLSWEASSPLLVESETIVELGYYIEAYRSRALQLDEAVASVSERLDGKLIEPHLIKGLVSRRQLAPIEAARGIFECAAEESPQSTPESSIDSQDSSVDMIKIAEDFISCYAERVAGGLDPGIALSEFRAERGLKDFHPVEASFIVAQMCGPEKSSDTPSPLQKDGGAPSQSSGSARLIRSDTPTPRGGIDNTLVAPKSKSTEWEARFSGTAGSPEHDTHKALSPSPEQGFSTDLWGIKMPTEQAKRLAQAIGLPEDYVHRCIRSLTKNRANARKLQKLSQAVTSSPRKRKASITAHRGRRTRSSDDPEDVDAFAKEGQSQDAFVRDNFEAGNSLGSASRNYVLHIDCLPTETASLEQGNQHGETYSSTEDTVSSASKESHDVDDIFIDDQDLASLLTRKTSLRKDGDWSLGTIIDYSGLRIMEEGLFRLALSSGDKLYEDSIQRAVCGLLQELALAVRSGIMQPVHTQSEEEFIIALFDLRDDPSRSTKYFRLSALIAKDRKERTKFKQSPSNDDSPSSDKEMSASPKSCNSRASNSPNSTITINPANYVIKHRRSFFVGLETLRQYRREANKLRRGDRYFQNAAPTASPIGSTQPLNKLFDKYKGAIPQESRETFQSLTVV